MGACTAALGGLDALAFSGGIGEHDASTWHDVADGLAWLGVRVRGDALAGGDGQPVEVTGDGSSVRVFVVPAREELELATEAEALVQVTRKP
jgi:acetate kinase